MMKHSTFAFDGFVLRSTNAQDQHLAEEWTEADPAHRGTPAAFWTTDKVDVKSFLLTDSQGPVFFFRMKAVWGMDPKGHVQVWIQFPPGSTRTLGERVWRGLIKGFAWLEGMMAQVGFEAVYFSTKNPKLAYFCRKRIGFVNTGRKDEQGEMILKRRLTTKAA